jgi:Domain of unknown function (DUF932)
MELIKEQLESIGLNWAVKAEKKQTESGILLDGIAIIREDTQTCLGEHSANYLPFQNLELMELLYGVSQKTGLQIQKGGSFEGGKKVYIQLKSDDLTLTNVGGINDVVEGFITGVNSFDGSTSIGFGNSNITISCRNKFFSAYRSLEKIRHTKNMMNKVDEVCRRIDQLVEDEKHIFEKIKIMASERYTQTNYEMVVRELFDLGNVQLDDETISTKKQNKILVFNKTLADEVAEKGDNHWGLFSGVTKYTTHIGKIKEENKMFGNYGDRERHIFKQLAMV